MIYLTTGGNGAGKTLLTLKDVREQQLKENRPVYYHGFKAGAILKEWGWQEFDPKDWQALPDGSICIFDECQNEFPAKIQGELPDYINAIAQHRRRRGFDFWMITPHPSLIHVNVRRLIESPSWHRHLKRTAGAAMVSELKFNFAEMKCEQPGSGARGVVTMRAYPKEVYQWYESASLHTGKVRIPKQVWMVAACAVLVPTLGYLAFTKVYGNVTKHAKPQEQQQGVQPAQGLQPGRERAQKLTVNEYLQERTPRLSGLPHTAPAFDDVTKPTEAPYPAACVEMGGKCKCYTQQATLLQVAHEMCIQIVRNGFFMEWGKQREETRMVADRGQRMPPSYVPPGAVRWEQQQQPQQVAQLDQQPQSVYSQALAKRNSEVRSRFDQQR